MPAWLLWLFPAYYPPACLEVMSKESCFLLGSMRFLRETIFNVENINWLLLVWPSDCFWRFIAADNHEDFISFVCVQFLPVYFHCWYFFFWVIVFAMSYRGAVCVRTRGQWFHRRWDTEETVQNCLKGKCREPADLKRVSCFRSGDWLCFSKCKFYSCCCSSDQNVRSSPFSRITFVHLRCCWFCCFFPSPLFRLWWQQERNRFLLFMWIHKRKMRCCNAFQQELF